jgi:hypothetical protein
VSRLPLGVDGVPTQTSAMSVAATAAAASLVAVSRPARTCSAISSPILSSTTGVRPSVTIATLSGLTSTPMTVDPRLARHAADTVPT